MQFTKEDIELIEQFIQIKNKGYYCDGKQLTEVYNRVLEKNVNITNCGSCLRGRVQELENALNKFKIAQEASKKPEPTVDTPEENKEPVEKKATKKKK